MRRRHLRAGTLLVAAIASSASVAGKQARSTATYVSGNWPIPAFEVPKEAAATETLVDVLDAAYRSSPSLQAERYSLRADDEDYSQALSELRPTSVVQVSGEFRRTVPGRTTQARRSPVDQLASPNFNDNSLNAQAIVNQPLYSGGKAIADIGASLHSIRAGRERLKGVEGDLLLQVITAYCDFRRDERIVSLRSANLNQLQATLDEVRARREAGELTLTDVAQVSTQYASAIVQANSAREQLEQDRAVLANLVGHSPGTLAAPPPLPQLPQSLDAAYSFAARLSPELGQAIETERASRDRIVSAKSEGRPKVGLRGTASFGGQAYPFDRRNDDQVFTGGMTITIPVGNGGRVGSLVAQAYDRNSADRARIEEARRLYVRNLTTAWNGVATAQRNIAVEIQQLEASKILDEGTFEEYRAGLRSTFDVLFAHSSRRDSEIALVSTERDVYVAEANLLRAIGLLQMAAISEATPLYDVEANTKRARRRGALPWDSVIRSIDGILLPHPTQPALEQPALPDREPSLVPASPPPRYPIATSDRAVPLPGTVGVPIGKRQ